jgi:hypothetical protein
MVAILPRTDWPRQASIRANATKERLPSPKAFRVAGSFATEIEKLCGANLAASSLSARAELVVAKLEMVRAGWLSRHVNIVHRFSCLYRGDRVQRGEID